MKRLLVLCCLIAASSSNAYASYCASRSSNFSYEWINRVSIGDIDQLSSGSQYSSYQTTAALDIGSEYPVQMTPGYRSYAYTEHWMVWIDLNQDSVFSSDERVFYKSGSGIQSGSFVFPDATPGSTRMRVTMAYGGETGACASFTYGEVEDYVITINDPSITLDPSVEYLMPEDGSILPVTNSSIEITFNKSMDSSSITSDSFSLVGDSGAYTFSLSAYDDIKNSVILFLDSALPYDENLVLTISSDIKDIFGVSIDPLSVNYLTESDPALQPFEMVSSNIANDFSTDDNLKLTFNSLVDISSASVNSISLVNNSSGQSLSINGFSLEDNGQTLVMDVGALSFDTEYTLHITNLMNIHGALLDQTELNFETESEPVSYCDSYGNGGSPGLSSVSIGTKSYSLSYTSNYSDKTSSPATIESYLNTQLNADVYKGSNYDMYYAAWVDWNNDKEFTASENLKHLVTSANSFSLYIKPPLGTPAGQYSMRLSARLQSYAYPCGDLGHGTTVDFTLNVID